MKKNTLNKNFELFRRITIACRIATELTKYQKNKCKYLTGLKVKRQKTVRWVRSYFGGSEYFKEWLDLFAPSYFRNFPNSKQKLAFKAIESLKKQK